MEDPDVQAALEALRRKASVSTSPAGPPSLEEILSDDEEMRASLITKRIPSPRAGPRGSSPSFVSVLHHVRQRDLPRAWSGRDSRKKICILDPSSCHNP